MTPSAVRVRVPTSRAQRILLVAGIVLVAINLRPTLASVGPLVGHIRADTGLSAAALGLLTTLPLVAFAIVSLLAPLVSRRLGLGGAIAAALVLLLVGAAIRGASSAWFLFGGTILLGIGIALGNVLLPALVKRDFAHRSGMLTSLYSSVMAVGASIAAGISVPVSGLVGWRGALSLWALPVVVALAVWLPQLKPRMGERSSSPSAFSFRFLVRSRLAWQVALFMGCQSLTFYVILAWLPDLLQDRGMTPAEAGWMLALCQATGILGSAVVPIQAGRLPNQRSIVWGLGAIEAVALLGLLLRAPDQFTFIWAICIGFALGGTFGLALIFFVLRAPSTAVTTQLSAMAQSIGYLIAATGPVLFGFFHDLTDGWTVPLLFLVAVLGGKIASGLGAGRAESVGDGSETAAVPSV